MQSRATQLLELGQSVWLDFIRRELLVSGAFDRLVRDQGVVGVTSNPTIFQNALAEGHDYDESITRLVASGLEGEPLFEALAIEDIQMACDRLRTVWDQTAGRDGRVSLEVPPHVAHDTPATIATARRYAPAVDRPNLMIKVPATAEGLPAIEELTADGLSINVTLIFSLSRYAQVMESYLKGLERRAQAGQPLDRIRSVASFFVSRVDSKVDKAIDEAAGKLAAGSPERTELEDWRGKAAIANARLAYSRFRETFATARWQRLADRGAHVQRPLWASTSTKNPAYRDVLYVEELIGRDTVNTMPPQTLDAFNDHGVVETRIENDLPGARRLFERLPALGIPVDALIDQLEGEGVQAFAKSYDSLLATLATRRRELVA